MTAARSIRRNRFCGADAVNNSPGERPGERDVLIVTDPQCDFCPGGALAVPRGDTVIPVVNRLARRFAHVVITQDWHPADHISFAGAHVGRGPFETGDQFREGLLLVGRPLGLLHALAQKRGIEFETVQLIFEIVNDLDRSPT